MFSDSFGNKIKEDQFEANEAQPISSILYLVDSEYPRGFSTLLAQLHRNGTRPLELTTTTDAVVASTDFDAGNTATTYNILDAQQSVRVRLHGSPFDQTYLDYAAFGEHLQVAGTVNFSSFSGQIHDSRIQMRHHRARWASPATGSWISPDPILDEQGGLFSAYAYVGHNPVNRIDPLGLFTLTELIASVSIIHLAVSLFIAGEIWFLEKAKSWGYELDKEIKLLKTIDKWWDIAGLVLAVVDLYQMGKALITSLPKMTSYLYQLYGRIMGSGRAITQIARNSMKGEMFELFFKWAWGWTKNGTRQFVSGMRTFRFPDFMIGANGSTRSFRSAKKIIEVAWETGSELSPRKVDQLKDLIVLASQSEGRQLIVVGPRGMVLPQNLTLLAQRSGVSLTLYEPGFNLIQGLLRSLFQINVWGNGFPNVIWDDDV